MLKLLTQASKLNEIEAFCDAKMSFQYSKSFQLFPGDPIIYKDDELYKGTWHKRHAIIDIHRSIKTQPFSKLLRSKRALIPVNCFYGKLGQKVYLIKLAKQRTFYIGALSNNGNLSVLSTAAPKILSKQLNEIPVIIDKEAADTWLRTSDMMEVFELVSNSDLYWFDMYPVNTAICESTANDPSLLKAIGPSLMDKFASSDEELKKTLEQNRTRRGK